MTQSKIPKSIIIITGLTVLFLAMRLLVLFSYLNRLYEPEELYRGTITREIIKGPLMSPWEYLDYKVDYFPGGTLVVGILAVPFFLLFGHTYISLKLVGLVFALGTFLLWYLFMDRFFNRRTAVITAAVFLLCMPFYTMTSFITWGSHPETNFFTILSIFIFCNIFLNARVKSGDNIFYTGYKNFFLLGLISGFGLWFVETSLIPLLFLLIFWFIFDRRVFLRKVFFIFCLGFITGFSPAIYYELVYKGNALAIRGQSLLSNILACNINGALPKALLLFSHDLPNSFLFGNIFNLNGKIFSYLYYFIFLSAFAYLFWINRKIIFLSGKAAIYPITLKEVKVAPAAVPSEVIILAYPVFFLSCFILSDYWILSPPWEDPLLWPHYIGYRYLTPAIPFFLAILGIFAGKMKNKILFSLTLLFVLGLGLLGNLNIISMKNFGKFFSYKGYSYNIIGDKIGFKISRGLGKYIAPFNKLPENEKIQFYEGLGTGIALRMEKSKPETVIRFFEKEINAPYQPFLYRGWGSLFFANYPDRLRRALAAAKIIEPRYRPFFYEGFGRKVEFSKDVSKLPNYIRAIELPYRQFYYKGFGFAVGLVFGYDKRKEAELIEIAGSEYKKFVKEGIVEGETAR
jgi:hypothetical protein